MHFHTSTNQKMKWVKSSHLLLTLSNWHYSSIVQWLWNGQRDILWRGLPPLTAWVVGHNQSISEYKRFFFTEREWNYMLSILPGHLGCYFQYTPVLQKMSIHCIESGWIGKYAPIRSLHPSALKIALGQSLGPRCTNCLRGRIFQYIPPLGSVFYRVSKF